MPPLAPRPSARRSLRALAAALALGLLTAGCGGAHDDPDGTAAAAPSRVAAAEADGPTTTAGVGYEGLVGQQSRAPRDRFSPCNLVTPAEAATILHGPVLTPVEAPQGPSCLYRRRAGGPQVALAVLEAPLATIRPRPRRAARLGRRRTWCGSTGAPVLYVPFGRDRVLGVTAPCATARRFARIAAPRLVS